MAKETDKLPDAITMSVRETAQALNRPVRTIQFWCERGELPATKISGTWLINTSKLAELLDL